MEMGGVYNSILALVIFCAAAITDFFDGQIARKNKTITSVGIFLDPLADKLLISAAFICFVDIPWLGIPAWMVITIITREFLITGLRSIAASKNIIISADKAGKFKTTSQIVVIILILIVLIMNEIFFKFLASAFYTLVFYDNGFYADLAVMIRKIPFWATFITVVLTVYSGFNYIWKYRKLLNENN
jgi:CDP-diacylglycerol--glycerol-3-phosphate 3-phosphatidyltransferase